jgi:methanogenic corrinoid protein MtbC1
MGAAQETALAGFKEKFLDFQIDGMEDEATKLLAAGVSIQDFLQACMPCMEQIGQKFGAGEYYLPQLVVAGEMFKTVNERMKSSLKTDEVAAKYGDIVLGTPKGDIHDLGKDIFKVLAQASGFAVHDLGVDVPPEAFVEKLKETGSTILGMSTLLTTAFETVSEVVNLLDQNGLRQRTFVILGGGATEASLIDKLGVDAQTRDAYDGVTQVLDFVGTRDKEMVV